MRTKDCDKCIHQASCMRIKEKYPAVCNDRKCPPSDMLKLYEYSAELLSGIMAQAETGNDWSHDRDYNASVWFSRIYVYADELLSEITGSELTPFSQSNPKSKYIRHP